MPTEKSREYMTSRERVRAVLEGKRPDRLPFNFWMDRNLMADLDKKLGPEFRINHYGADVHECYFGIDWNCGLPAHIKSDHKTSWHIAPGLPDMEDMYKLCKFPAHIDPAIYHWLDEDRKRLPDISLFALAITPLEGFFSLRMMENAMTDFFEYPDEVEYYMNEGGRLLTESVKGLDGHGVDLLYLAGDICSSNGAMLSEAMLRKYCFEPIKDAIIEAHKLGLKVFMHSDGNLKDVLPLYVEYGIDGCNPLQPHVNDARAFKTKYGGKLMLYGGIDNCFAIPDNDPEGVRRHILDQYEILGKEGGFIFSSHDIPDYVDIKNIDMMVKTIKEIET